MIWKIAYYKNYSEWVCGESVCGGLSENMIVLTNNTHFSKITVIKIG